jgi:hypothetical protein
MVGLVVIVILIGIVVICVPNLSYAQTTTNSVITNNTKSNNTSTFHSAFDTFVAPGSVNGYGIYQPHDSSIFRPGEKIVLYIEPVGYSYKPIGSMFLMNFTGDLLISDKAGHILGGFQNLPLSTIISHHKNKELTLTVSLTQTNPFPPGDYVLKYTIHDMPSGNTFDIIKNITINNG